MVHRGGDAGTPWWGEINMATSTLPSQGSHGGEKSTWLHQPCLLGVPMVGRNQHGYITLAFSGFPWWGEINMATSPLPSQGSHGGEKSTWLHQPCLLRVPMVGRNQHGYITPAFSGFPWWGEINMATSPLPSQGSHGGEKSTWLHHPCLLRVPMVGRNQYGYITPAFSGFPWWGEINMATSPLPSQGSHGGEKSTWLHHPCLLRVPMVGRNQHGYINPAFSGFPWWGEINMATSPLPSRGSHGGEKSIWLHQPCLLRVPMVGRNQYGYITPAFSGFPWWGEINMATSTLPSQGSHGGEKSIWLHQPCLLRVPMVGRNQYGYITPAFSGFPWWGEINMAT